MVFWFINFLAILINGFIIIAVVSFLQQLFGFDLSWFTQQINTFFGQYGLPKVPPIPYQSVPGVISGIILFFFILLSMTPPVDYIIRYFSGFRRPIRDERDRLYHLFSSVCNSAGVSPADYKLYITDDAMANACALGDNNIAITRKLLKHYPDEQVRGVLAHELGHLHYGDSLQKRIFLTVNIIGQIVLWGFKLFTSLFSGLHRLPIPIFNWFTWLIARSSWIMVIVIDLMIILPLSFAAYFGYRRNEYRADRYAVEIGQGDGLYDFLYNHIDEETARPRGLGLVWETHPSDGKRIYQLEKMQEARGSLAPAQKVK